MNKREAKREVAGWLIALTTMPENFEDEFNAFDEKDHPKLKQALDEIGDELARRYDRKNKRKEG